MKKGTKVRRNKEYYSGNWDGIAGNPNDVYEVEDANIDEIYVRGYWWVSSYFIEVKDESFEDQILRGYGLLGQKVYYNCDGISLNCIVQGIEVIHVARSNYNHYSSMVTTELGDKGKVVVLRLLQGRNIPLSAVLEKPSTIEVVLNSSYSASVSKDTIQVGCQTFPIGILQELLEAYNKL